MVRSPPPPNRTIRFPPPCEFPIRGETFLGILIAWYKARLPGFP